MTVDEMVSAAIVKPDIETSIKPVTLMDELSMKVLIRINRDRYNSVLSADNLEFG